MAVLEDKIFALTHDLVPCTQSQRQRQRHHTYTLMHARKIHARACVRACVRAVSSMPMTIINAMHNIVLGLS